MHLLHIYPEQLQAIIKSTELTDGDIANTATELNLKLIELWLQKNLNWVEDSFCVANATFSDGSCSLLIDYPTDLSAKESLALVTELLSKLNSNKSLTVSRCKTCEHFRSNPDKRALGQCERSKPTENQAVTLSLDLVAKAVDRDYYPAYLHVSPDFGCILHEELSHGANGKN